MKKLKLIQAVNYDGEPFVGIAFDGVLLPGQVETIVRSEGDGAGRVEVTFRYDAETFETYTDQSTECEAIELTLDELREITDRLERSSGLAKKIADKLTNAAGS